MVHWVSGRFYDLAGQGMGKDQLEPPRARMLLYVSLGILGQR